MKTDYLLLAVLTATFGFILWYYASATLRLPRTYQIQFDINVPFMNRYLRSRDLMFVLFALVPYVLIAVWKVIGDVTLTDLGISFIWNGRSSLWITVSIPLIVLYNLFTGKSDANLTEYPEIRVTRWTARVLLLSACTWALQIFALEFLFRGLLLQSIGNYVGTPISILLCTGIYSLTQYFRSNRDFLFSIPYSLLACYIVIDADSLLPVMVIHLADALSKEWFSVWRHPEIRTA